MTLSKKRGFYLSLFIIIVLVGVAGCAYFVKNMRDEMLNAHYKETAQNLQHQIDELIVRKQKATLALALTLAKRDINLLNYTKQKHFPSHYLANLIAEYKKNTHYQNIWIQVFDKRGVSLYRSWTPKHGDKLLKIRADVAAMIKQHKNITSMSVGQYSLSIKAMVPLFNKGRFIGAVEVISHFNSIAKVLKQEGWQSVVLADKQYKKQLIYPFTKTFIGDYYVANLGVKKELLEYLQQKNLQHYFKNHYESDQSNFIVSHPLYYHKQLLGTYILVKPLVMMKAGEVEGFVFRWLVFGVILLMALAGVVNIYLYIILRRQKDYYKNIIDSSHNIILVSDKVSILDANKTFFKYFTNYKDLAAFRAENKCICHLFESEEGYLEKGNMTYNWLDVVLDNPEANHKVKMKIDDKLYYFTVNAALISQEKEHYSVIFSDITQEEMYKKALENMSIKDALTNVYNRRYYEEQIEKEMSDAKRYHYNLSLIMFDIDFFKKVNDVHGHSVGDEVLIHLSGLINASLREGDALCRIGGEEFMVILPYTAKEDAAKIAEKLRIKVEQDKEVLPVTISLGVTEYITGEAKDYLYSRVDTALYEAKENGRNRVVVV